jgi:hypothetical protein
MSEEDDRPTNERTPDRGRLKKVGEAVAVILKAIAAAVTLYAAFKGIGPADR